MRRLWAALRRFGSDRRGFSDYVALAIATPLALMAFVGGSAIVETVSAQAALHTAAGMADRSLVADGCLTSNTLQAMDATLQAAHMNPSAMTLKTTTASSTLYGSRGLAVQVGYQIPLTIPGTPWVLTSRYATAQVSNDQSQAVPYDGSGQSACASTSLVAATFSGTAGTGGGGSSVQLPPEPTAVSETVSPNPDVVGSALTVSGVVTSNGTPMADVPVAVAVGSQASTTVSTNAQGQYSATLTPTQAGAVTVSVTAGPATNQQTVTIQPLAPASITLNVPSSVTVGQEFSIQGTVFAANGQPVANGTAVTVSSSDTHDIPTQTVTTVGGQFTVSVPSGITTLGTVTVTATAGSVSQSATITVQPGPPESVTLALSPAAGTAGSTWTASGTVLGPDHTPVASGTTVQLASSTDTRDTLPAFTTNAQGQFSGSVTLTEAGAETFTAQAGTAQSAPVTVTVTPGPPVQVASMQAAPNPVNQGATTVLSGTVLDAYGNPEPAGVTITLTSTGWSQSVTTTTGSGGVFQVPVSFTQSGNQVVQAAAGSTPLENGTTTVSVNAEGAYTLSATQASTTMTAGQTQTVTWTLVDSQGNPVPNIVLAFRATPSSGTTLSETSGTTNSQGQVTMTVSATEAGTLTVTATAATSPNTTGTATWVVNPATPKTVDPPTISPSVVQSTQDGGTVIPVVTGLALDSYGNPLANATVSVTGGWDPGVTATGTTDAEGYFSVPIQPVDVGGPYYPTITVTDSAGSNTTTYTNTSLTVVKQVYVLTLTPTSGSTITPAGTPYGVQVSLSAYGPHSGAPVPNATVTLTVSSGDAGYWAAGATAPTPSSPRTITVTTNSQGTALAEVAFEPNTGQQVITGSWATDNTTGTLDVLVTANSPTEAVWQSLTPNPVTAGQTFTWAAQLLDSYGFPLSSGQSGSWTFDNLSGTATTGPWDGLEGVATGAGAPTTAGSHPVTLTLDGQTYTSGSVTVNPGPVRFLYPVLGPANNTNGTLLPGGSWNGTTMAYGTLPASDGTTLSTRFTAYDAYGNAVPNWATGTVTCTASNGGSCPTLTQPGQPTNSQGQSGWANEGPFPAGSYTLTYTPSGGDVTASPETTSVTFTVPWPYDVLAFNGAFGTGLANVATNPWSTTSSPIPAPPGQGFSTFGNPPPVVRADGHFYAVAATWPATFPSGFAVPDGATIYTWNGSAWVEDQALTAALSAINNPPTGEQTAVPMVKLVGGPHRVAVVAVFGYETYSSGTWWPPSAFTYLGAEQTATGISGPYTAASEFNFQSCDGNFSYEYGHPVDDQGTVTWGVIQGWNGAQCGGYGYPDVSQSSQIVTLTGGGLSVASYNVNWPQTGWVPVAQVGSLQIGQVINLNNTQDSQMQARYNGQTIATGLLSNTGDSMPSIWPLAFRAASNTAWFTNGLGNSGTPTLYAVNPGTGSISTTPVPNLLPSGAIVSSVQMTASQHHQAVALAWMYTLSGSSYDYDASAAWVQNQWTTPAQGTPWRTDWWMGNPTPPSPDVNIPWDG